MLIIQSLNFESGSAIIPVVIDYAMIDRINFSRKKHKLLQLQGEPQFFQFHYCKQPQLGSFGKNTVEWRKL